jgi:uncharacterized membrane protein
MSSFQRDPLTVADEQLRTNQRAVVAGQAAHLVLVDAPYRSLFKAISWRATGTIDTIVVSLVVTRHLGVALSIGSIELFTKLALYYLHERVWNRLAFGRTRIKDDYQI